MKHYFLFAIFGTFLMAGCDSAGSGSTATLTLEGSNYEIVDVPGSADVQQAILRDPAGNIMEMGFVRNGLKTGTWTYNRSGEEFPEKIISLVDGRYNGLYMEFNERGQVTLLATYKDNMLHGPWGQYRFGRPEKTATYVNGEIDGIYREYDFRNGNLKKEVSYKNGKEDGLMRFYDEDGSVLMEYNYRNGEKVSGGVVEQETPVE
jgi:antitoxin component YwqK of YwqJK toxin-antitoxin module